MDTRRIRRLRDPLQVEVQQGPDGQPLRILLSKTWREVSLTRPPWRIDQHWWRGEAIRREYFQVAPADSPVLTIYHDLATGEWARQEYVGAGEGRTGLKKTRILPPEPCGR